jgi:hypothetical protein
MLTLVNPCVVVKDGVVTLDPRYIFAVSKHIHSNMVVSAIALLGRIDCVLCDCWLFLHIYIYIYIYYDPIKYMLLV